MHPLLSSCRCPNSRDKSQGFVIESDFSSLGSHIQIVTELCQARLWCHRFSMVLCGHKTDRSAGRCYWRPFCRPLWLFGKDRGTRLQDHTCGAQLPSFHKHSHHLRVWPPRWPCSPPGHLPRVWAPCWPQTTPLAALGFNHQQWLSLRTRFGRGYSCFTVSFLGYIHFESFSFLFFQPLSLPNSRVSFVPGRFALLQRSRGRLPRCCWSRSSEHQGSHTRPLCVPLLPCTPTHAYCGWVGVEELNAPPSLCATVKK